MLNATSQRRGWSSGTFPLVRIAFIVNSVASSVTARRRVLIHKALARKHDVVTTETTRRGHATRLAQQAANDKMDLVVVLGGDGTLNEAANGLAGTDTALATLPGGSTNVFARILGLPDESVDAAHVLLEALDENHINRIGLGSVEGRYFLFHCGVGFDAAVVEQVERRGSWKRWAGHPLFIYSAIETWARRFDRNQPPIRVVEPDGASETTGFFTIVLNANPYTYLGNRPFDLLPDLTLRDPLAAITLKELDVGTLSSVALRSLRGKPITTAANLSVARNLDSLVVESDPPMPYQVDGDHLGASKRLRFTWTPDHLALLRPLP